MEAVRDEAERIGPDTIDQLHEREGEVEDEEAEEVARVLVRHDQPDPAHHPLPPPPDKP